MGEEELQSYQHHYGHLCAEKCRLLSAIEHNNREGRALQRELHRLLDFIAEMVPEDSIISDVADTDEFDGEWLDESDEELNIINETQLNRKVSELKERYMTIKNSGIPRRRRSISPDRKTKPRRNYKYLPTQEDGSVELPVVLGRGVHRTIVLSLGTVEAGKNFSHGKYVYPVGFQSKRKYFKFDTDAASADEKPKKIYYFCSIKKSEDNPLFEIFMNEHPGDSENEVSAQCQAELMDSDTNLIALWDRFKDRFTSPLKDQLEEDFHDPETFLGLEHESLLKYFATSD